MDVFCTVGVVFWAFWSDHGVELIDHFALAVNNDGGNLQYSICFRIDTSCFTVNNGKRDIA